MEKQRQRLKEDDVLALCCIALGQNGRLTHNGALGLLGQLVQSLQGAAGGDDVTTTSTRLPFILSSSLRSMTSFCFPAVVMD